MNILKIQNSFIDSEEEVKSFLNNNTNSDTTHLWLDIDHTIIEDNNILFK